MTREGRRARGHRGAGHAGAAAQIHDQPGGVVGRHLIQDAVDQQEVQRPVVQGKCGPLPGAVERPALGQRRLAPLHVRRRQRPQRPRDLAEAQVGQMTLLELRHEK